MTVAASDEEIAAATLYEELHVPALFQDWAPLVVKAAAIRHGHRVLDVACGTGVLAREAASHVGDGGHVAGLDASVGRLAVAERIAPSIEWREGMAEALSFEDGSFDAVVSQFGMMFFSNPVTAIREMLRVLVPGGRIAVAVWDSLNNSEAYRIEVELLDRLGGRSAGNALRIPFSLGDRTELTTLFRDAGARSVEVASHQGTARFPSIRSMIEADLRVWLPLMGVDLSEAQIEAILGDAEQQLQPYVTTDGAVQFAAPGHIVTAAK